MASWLALLAGDCRSALCCRSRRYLCWGVVFGSASYGRTPVNNHLAALCPFDGAMRAYGVIFRSIGHDVDRCINVNELIAR